MWNLLSSTAFVSLPPTYSWYRPLSNPCPLCDAHHRRPVIFHMLTLPGALTRLRLTEDRLKIRGFVDPFSVEG